MKLRTFATKLSILIVLVLLLSLPLFSGYHMLLVVTIACIYTILASCMRVSLNSGQLNFGVAAFMAIGAYCSGLMVKELSLPFIPAFLAAGFFSALAGILIGYPSLRLPGVYFLLLTWAFVEVVRAIAVRWTSLTGGPLGLFDVPPISIGRIVFTGVLNYYFVLVVTTLILLILYRLEISRIGLTLKSIGQEEGLAEALGIDTYKFKNISFLISCFFAGLAGSLYVHSLGVISPDVLSFLFIVSIAVYNFFGGIGHFFGPVVGAGILTLLTEPFRGFVYFERIIYSLTIILIVLFLPDGIISLPQKMASGIDRFRHRERSTSA